MSSDKGSQKQKKAGWRGEVNKEKKEQNNIPETPVKRIAANSDVSSVLSPLPLPPKAQHFSLDLYSPSKNVMRYVETPVVKENPRFLPIPE